MAPSDYVRRHLKLTPFAGEDIGWLLRSGAEDLRLRACVAASLERELRERDVETDRRRVRP